MRNVLAFAALLLLSVGPVLAATPPAATLSDAKPLLTYSSGPFNVANASDANGPPTCVDPAAPCDDFALTVTVPAGYAKANPGANFSVSIAWTNAKEEFDVFLLDAKGDLLSSSASSVSPNVVTQTIADGTTQYTVRIDPAIALGGSTTATIKLLAPASAPPIVQNQPSGLPPRFKVDSSPSALANTSGEPSIGYNYKSRNGMFISNLQQLRLVFPWKQTNPLPDSDPQGVGAAMPDACDANWVDATNLTASKESLDPILYTDSVSGRTFVSQLTGANSLFSYSDDDGASWMQGQVGPPNGGPDHQTIGTGPYPAASPFAQVAKGAGFGYATYYCSQGIVDAFCSRSEDGGLTFGAGAPQRLPTDCGTLGALHGHVKVGPDGAVYVAPKSCGANQAVFVSTDAATTFTTMPLPKTTADTEVDPSIGIDSDNTVYDCFIGLDHHPHVQVSTDHGAHWLNDYDIGASAGVVNATFVTAIAGSSKRAACAFAGTSTGGNHDAANFAGIWYNYIAVTYDGGLSWFTVNLSPNDPVQGAGGLCNGGTLCGNNRNLLDFTEITMDEFGRILFGYADGCIGPCVQDPILANSFANKGAVGRQIGGRSLLAKYDKVEPVAPSSACLMGARTKSAAQLSWNPPDTGGADLSSYTIYRSASAAGPFTQVGTTTPKSRFIDSSDSTTDPLYYKITATNAQGQGLYSNIIKLPIGPEPVLENSCALPGITVFTVKPGSNTGGSASPDTDLLRGGVVELPAAGSKNNFTFILQFAQLMSPPTPGDYYIILTQDVTGKAIYLQADTNGNPGGMAFTYGTYAAGTAGVLTFTELGSLDPASTFDPKTGNVYLVVPRTILGSPAVGKSFPIDVRIRQGAQSATSRDAGGPGAYTVNGTDICTALVLPLASLAADVQNGMAPLTVKFDGSASSTSSTGATISSYSFDFGDGSAAVTQASPTVSHVYNSVGSFAAKLTVTDSKNQTSTNPAQKVITITGGSVPGPGPGTAAPAPATTGRFGGGAFGLLGLLPLLVMGLRRRRRRG